jgi:uncharacterized protein (TIGR00730 family)
MRTSVSMVGDSGLAGEGTLEGKRSLRLCVFCGARPGSPDAVTLARETGRAIGDAGHRLVYGAGGSGLMGEVATAAWEHGADITGIAPRFLYERERGIAAPPYRAVVPETMFERKQLMLDTSDAFLALPGGYGTLDEVLEVISLKYLGMCDKPLILLGVDNFWEPLFALDKILRMRGFVDDTVDRGFELAFSAGEALDLIERRVPGPALVSGPA